LTTRIWKFRYGKQTWQRRCFDRIEEVLQLVKIENKSNLVGDYTRKGVR
jgi:hypothetical protein